MKLRWILLLCGGFAAGWWMGQRYPLAPMRAGSAVPEKQPEVALLTRGHGSDQPHSDLPPLHTPLLAIHDALVERAQSGDSNAALRLYQELQRCRIARGMTRIAAQADSATAPSAAQRRSRDAQQIQTCAHGVLCAGISVQQEREWISWLALAAEAGQSAARLKFAEGQFLSSAELYALQHAPLYRKYALQWMHDSATAGHRAATLQLALAYLHADDAIQSPLAQLVEQDRERGASYLYGYALAMAPGALEVDLQRLNQLLPSTRLSASEAQTATAPGRDWYKRYLQHSPVPMGAPAPGYMPALNAAEIARIAPQCLPAEQN
jgi:hypothetical protein